MHEPGRTHIDAQGCIYAVLRHWVHEALGRGWAALPLDVLLDHRNVHQPDVAWYREDRAPERGDRAPFPVPDTRSCGSSTPPRTFVLVFRRSKAGAAQFDVSLELTAGETLASPLLSGFTPAVGEIFSD